MYRNRKNDVAEVPPEQTPVWECESEDCLGWMRKNFSFEEEPKCPLCKSSMKSGERLLPKLLIYNKKPLLIKRFFIINLCSQYQFVL